MDRNDGSLEVFRTAVLIYKKAQKPQIFRYSELSATGQKSYIIAAPIEIKGGDNKGEYWMGVVVKSNAESQRMYTHDVVAKKKKALMPLKPGRISKKSAIPEATKLSSPLYYRSLTMSNTRKMSSDLRVMQQMMQPMQKKRRRISARPTATIRLDITRQIV